MNSVVSQLLREVFWSTPGFAASCRLDSDNEIPRRLDMTVDEGRLDHFVGTDELVSALRTRQAETSSAPTREVLELPTALT